mmetsp:Transcript_11376/g.46095  ORF Transcript_11376/g.46095 Transcript_11376/m.46095 type:complete len:430 (-) Transcript_11376:487-1776(-)
MSVLQRTSGPGERTNDDRRAASVGAEAGVAESFREHLDALVRRVQFALQLRGRLGGRERLWCRAGLARVVVGRFRRAGPPRVRVERHQHGRRVGAAEPLVGRHRRRARRRVGVEVFLEHVRLARHDERQGLDDALPVLRRQLEALGRLALHHVEAPFRQKARSLRSRRRFVLGQREAEGFVVDAFVVADVAVALAAQVEHLGVGVEVREDDPGGLVDVDLGELFLEIPDVPDLELPLRLLGEPHCSQLARGSEELHLGGFRALMRLFDTADDRVLSRVAESDDFVLARRRPHLAFVIPHEILDELVVRLRRLHLGALLDVPDFDREVARDRPEDVVGRRVKPQQRHFARMAVQVDERFGQRLGEAVGRDAPDLDREVLRGRRDEVLVERVEIKVQDGALVTRDDGRRRRVRSLVGVRHDGHRPAAARER